MAATSMMPPLPPHEIAIPLGHGVMLTSVNGEIGVIVPPETLRLLQPHLPGPGLTRRQHQQRKGIRRNQAGKPSYRQRQAAARATIDRREHERVLGLRR